MDDRVRYLRNVMGLLQEIRAWERAVTAENPASGLRRPIFPRRTESR